MSLRHTKRGFTLIELTISLTLLGVILGALFGAVITVQRSFTSQQVTVRSQEALRAAEMVITTVLRSVRADPNDAKLSFLDPDPFSTGNFFAVRATADFNPSDGDIDDLLEDVLVVARNDTLYVRWQAGTPPQAMAEPVDSLLFEYFDYAGTALTTAASAAANASMVRLTIVAAEEGLSPTVERRVSWVYLRNR